MFCGKCGAANPDDAEFCASCGNNLKTSASPSQGPAAPSVPEFSFGAIPAGQANFQLSTAISNAINLVKSPGKFMRQNKDVNIAPNSTIMNYVVVLAAIPFVATLIGDLWYYAASGLYGYALAVAVATYIFDVIAVFVIGFIIWRLAPSFGTTTTQGKATLLAAFVYTPIFLISIVDIIPFIGFLTILGLLYGLYILYIGVPILLGTPGDKVLSYVLVTIVVSLVVYFIFFAIVGAIAAAVFLAPLL